MKKFLISVITLFICVVCYGATFNQYWYVEDNAPIQTSCTTGGDIILPTPPIKYGYDFIGWEKLPITRIEYLESTGTQYIDTGYVIDNSMSFDLKSRCLGTSFVFGSRQDQNTYASGLNYDKTDNLFGIRMGNAVLYNSTQWETNKDYEFHISNGDIKINGITVSTANYGTSYYNGNAYLFTVNNNGTQGYGEYSIDRIYNFKMFRNNILIQDLIPVLDPDGVPCMFDKVEGKFYYNAGTGDFIAGPVIGSGE